MKISNFLLQVAATDTVVTDSASENSVTLILWLFIAAFVLLIWYLYSSKKSRKAAPVQTTSRVPPVITTLVQPIYRRRNNVPNQVSGAATIKTALPAEPRKAPVSPIPSKPHKPAITPPRKAPEDREKPSPAVKQPVATPVLPPIIISPEKEEQSEAKRIGYKPINVFEQTEPLHFPYVIMPKPDSLIKFPRKGRTGRKGYKEEAFKEYIVKHFKSAFQVYDDRFVLVKGKSSPYEPDFTLIDEKIGLNMFIDIEVDEPYEGTNDIATRKVTHYQHSDSNRNNAFRSRGWIVIRFAEIQVHQQPESCCLFIADVIKTISPVYKTPTGLTNYPQITPLRQWTKAEAEQWSRSKYRECYLGIDKFGTTASNYLMSNLEETDLGQSIEKDIKDEPFLPQEVPVKLSAHDPKLDLLQSVLANEEFVAFVYNGEPTVVKSLSISNRTFTAYCYVKNSNRNFNIDRIENAARKQSPFTFRATGSALGMQTIKSVVNTAIQYKKYLRIKYTRSSWNSIAIDPETGEMIMSKTEAEESTRTICNVQRATDALDQAHISRYNLNENHLTAYCNRRDEQRTFRFDRISELEILDIPYQN